jgi:virginiamycin B lyase
MPDSRASDPHTPVFDPHGILWFTVQRANMVGRLNPATGKIDLRAVPTPNATPAPGTRFFTCTRTLRRTT